MTEYETRVLALLEAMAADLAMIAARLEMLDVVDRLEAGEVVHVDEETLRRARLRFDR